LGNDYLVLEDSAELTPDLVRQICDRHHGVGGDGILEPRPPLEGVFGVRIWNPDGSVAEKSGNGLRIFAWWLVHRRDAPLEFAVHTGYDRVVCSVSNTEITVDMGRASVETGVRLDAVNREIVCVNLGNPHAVVFVETESCLDDLPWRSWGAKLENHSFFPNRTNVQIAQVLDRQTLDIRIWERGAGETLASGSSSCAAAAAAVATGRLDAGDITVKMPGGTLFVRVASDGQVRLRGPIEPVGVFEIWPSWLVTRATPSFLA